MGSSINVALDGATKSKTSELFERKKSIVDAKALQMLRCLGIDPSILDKINLDNKYSFNNQNIINELIRKVSTKGQAVLALIPMGIDHNQWVIGDVMTYRETGGIVDEITFVSSFYHTYNGSEYPLIYRFYYNNGSPMFEKQINIGNEKNKELITLTTISYTPRDRFPLEIFKNSYDSLSDIKLAGVESQLDLLDEIMNEFHEQYHISKSMLQVNTAISGTQSARIELARILEGKNYLESQGFASKLGVAQTITQPTNSLAINLTAISFLETDIYKKLNLQLPSMMEKKANKHGLEVVMDQKDLIRELFEKKKMYEYSFSLLHNNCWTFYRLGKPKPIEFVKFDVITQTLLKVLENETITPLQQNVVVKDMT